jgi:ferritin-like protein
MAHEGFHEENLPEEVKDYHRVIQSTMEELEAVDWYNQRAAATKDPEVRALMEHNRDEEIEHAVMGIEWLRRTNPVWDEMIREIMFQDGSIVEAEQAMTGKEGSSETPASGASRGGLNIGSLKRKGR